MLSRAKKNKNKIITRRIFNILTIKLTSISIILAYLCKLQIFDKNKYLELSEKNRIRISSKESLRGNILDCKDRKLAINQKRYSLICSPKLIHNKDLLLKNITSIIKMPKSEILEFEQNLYTKHSNFNVLKNIDWDTLTKIEFKIRELKGLSIIAKHVRFYPYSHTCSHIIGYIAGEDKNKNKVGKSGIEKSLEKELHGKPGIITHEVNSKGKISQILNETQTIPGRDINITIDIEIQKFIQKLLTQNGSSVVVTDIETGNIIAMNNYPSYDNNSFIFGFSINEWNSLIQDKSLPMINRSLQFQLQPGSTFKLISAIAALESNIVNKDSIFECKGFVKLGNRKFHCMKHSGHGQINLERAISQSCNSYFYEIAKKIDIDQLMNTALKFGLGIKYPTIPLDCAQGIVPNLNWRENNIKSKWKLGDSFNCIIGHGYLLTTPIQLAILATRIATGKSVTPQIIQNNNENTRTHIQMDVDDNHLNEIRRYMYQVVNSEHGTARKFASEKHLIAGKTGTAQVISSQNKNSGTARINPHAIFIGYAPYEKPKFAISVVIERGGGGYNAASIATKIFDYIC